MNPEHAQLLTWIDAQAPALRGTLRALAEINSGSLNADGVDTCARRLHELFAPLGAQAEFIELAPYRDLDDTGRQRERPLGRALRLRMRPDAPIRVFLGGHLDTVFGPEHSFQHVRELDGDRLNGPGVADLKGGFLVMYLALAAFERSSVRKRIGWEALFNPDEEIGSLSSTPLLAEAAHRNHLGLVYEPAYPDGGLASTRKGSGNFEFAVHGRAAHAGRNFSEGRNAIAAAGELACALHALNGRREGLTVNLGYVHGGGALNIVPERCVLKLNVRTASRADEAWLHDELEKILAAANAREGFRCELYGGFTRPPKPLTDGQRRLQDLVDDCGRQLGLTLAFRPTGGCCDGNNLAAAGLPNVDNLGVVGGDIHTEREWMRFSSLAERAKLSALLLLRLGTGELAWNTA
ncbi:MAG: hydrolase [Sinobacteraceae bacterium]|nr:hydrolase [Nevskiaceae bacterium]